MMLPRLFISGMGILTAFAILAVAMPQQAQAQRGGGGPVAVITTTVKPQVFSDFLEALGTAKANETVVVTADTAEKITAIHFEDGAMVKRGDLLVTLDKSEEEAELKAATADLDDAKSSYQRAKSLQATNALSKATLEERRSGLKRIEAEIEAIKARIEKRNITAPFDGQLGLREVSVGALIQPGTRITTIDDLGVIKVDFDVPSVFLASLKAGLPVSGKVEAYGNRTFTGEVKTIGTQIDPVTRTVKVRALIDNPDYLLKPGLMMHIVVSNNIRQALLIPEESLIKRADKNYVYVLNTQNGKTTVLETEVELGGRQPGVVEILSGLRQGDQIVVHGTVKMRDGAEVTIKGQEKNGQETLDQMLKQSSTDTTKE